MATLSNDERKRIVEELACYESPSSVAAWATETFGKEVSIAQVRHYDPTRSDKTGQQWVKLFNATRKTFNEDASRVAIAQKLWRLRELQSIAGDAKAETSDRLKAMEQAAKEMGEAYTNKRLLEHTGEDGEPVQITFNSDPPPPDNADD